MEYNNNYYFKCLCSCDYCLGLLDNYNNNVYFFVKIFYHYLKCNKKKKLQHVNQIK